MSHSDSEVREDLKRKIHKKLHVAMKAKNKMGNTKEFLTSWSNNRPAQAHIKSILQEIKLMEAVNTNNTDRLQSLLESGVDPNTTDGEMRSALHVAASKGYQDCVKLLLHYGADPNIRDSVRNTPLHLAACVHSLPVISMLINANADVTCLDIHGRNPLHLVSSKLQILQKGWREGAIEMVKLKFELQQVRIHRNFILFFKLYNTYVFIYNFR